MNKETNKYPLISTIIPVFNNMHDLQSAIKSALHQEGPFNLEIIIVDDCSTPPVKLQNHPNINLIRHKKNRGAAGARNTGMKNAKGEYIAFLDADDQWEPGKLEQQVGLMEASSDIIAGVFTPFYYQGFSGKLFNPELARNDWFDYFLMGCRVAPGSCFLFRKSVFNTIGPQDEALRHYEDWDWLLRIAQKYHFIHATSARTILKPSLRTRYDTMKECLLYVENKWKPSLGHWSLNKLKAAIAIEKAAMLLRQSHYITTLSYLLRSAIYSPKTLLYNIVWRYTGLPTGNRRERA